MLNILPGLVPAETPSPSLPLLKDWESRELWNPAAICSRSFLYLADICDYCESGGYLHALFFYIIAHAQFSNPADICESGWYLHVFIFTLASNITMWDLPLPAVLALVKLRMISICYICRTLYLYMFYMLYRLSNATPLIPGREKNLDSFKPFETVWSFWKTLQEFNLAPSSNKMTKR